MKIVLAVLVVVATVAANAAGQTCDASGLKVTFTPALPKPNDPIKIELNNVSTNCIYTLPSSCVYIRIHKNDCGGQAVVPFRPCSTMPIQIFPGTSYSEVWDQKDWMGNPVPPGTYAFRIQVQDPLGGLIKLCPTVSIQICTPPPQSYGKGSAGAGGLEPRFELTGEPTLGNPFFALSVLDAVGGAPAMLFVGGQPASIQAAFGQFLVDPNSPLIALSFPMGGAPGQPGAGQVTFAMPVPSQPSLLGLTAYLQALIGDAASTGNIATTDGLQLSICQ